jgi:hypothetical protein
MQKVREIDIKDVLSYALAGLPPSMFDDKPGEIHPPTSKSTLKAKLQVEMTDRRSADVIILDECAILWVIDWPAHVSVNDFVRNIVGYMVRCMQAADNYLVFDRYCQNSFKEATRTAKSC